MVDITQISNLPSLGTTAGTKITSGSSSSATAGTTSSDTANADALKNQFLSILLTQMQNQNPLDPMDTKDFTSQLAQFSSLEQQIDTNSKLGNLLTAINSSATTTAFNYIGQTAELNSKDTVAQDGKVNWNYAISSAADTVTVKIKNSAGKVLYEKDATNVGSGTYSINANIADLDPTLSNGDTLTLDVVAKDPTNTTIRTDVSTTIKVEGVESSSTGIDLRSGGLLYSLDDVLRFKSAVTTPITTPTTPTTTTTI